MNAETPAHKYYVLVYSIQKKKTLPGTWSSWSQMEGNNRAGAMIHLLLSACYDAQEGTVRYGSLTKEWIADNMAQNDTKRKQYLHHLDSDPRSIGEMIRDKINIKTSMISSSIQIVVWYGKPLEEFITLGITAEKASKVLRAMSRTISKGKTNSSIPYESFEVSEALNTCVSSLMESCRKLEKGEIPGYSYDAGRYEEFDPEGMEDPLPDGAPEDQKRTVNKNRVCAIFESPLWMAFRTNPDSNTLQNFVNGWQAGVVVKNVDTSKNAAPLVVLNKTAPPPFFLDDRTFGVVSGDRKKSTTMPKKQIRSPIQFCLRNTLRSDAKK